MSSLFSPPFICNYHWGLWYYSKSLIMKFWLPDPFPAFSMKHWKVRMGLRTMGLRTIWNTEKLRMDLRTVCMKHWKTGNEPGNKYYTHVQVNHEFSPAWISKSAQSWTKREQPKGNLLIGYIRTCHGALSEYLAVIISWLGHSCSIIISNCVTIGK